MIKLEAIKCRRCGEPVRFIAEIYRVYDVDDNTQSDYYRLNLRCVYCYRCGLMTRFGQNEECNIEEAIKIIKEKAEWTM